MTLEAISSFCTEKDHANRTSTDFLIAWETLLLFLGRHGNKRWEVKHSFSYPIGRTIRFNQGAVQASTYCSNCTEKRYEI
jgi:hypothetical protein